MMPELMGSPARRAFPNRLLTQPTVISRCWVGQELEAESSCLFARRISAPVEPASVMPDVNDRVKAKTLRCPA
jgi:hypothetical protein